MQAQNHIKFIIVIMVKRERVQWLRMWKGQAKFCLRPPLDDVYLGA